MGLRGVIERPLAADEAGCTSEVVPVTFRFPARLAPDARTVSLVGSFNGWDLAAHPLRKTGDDWTISVYLSPGRVVYTFWVDGVLWLDPEDDGRIPNGWGSEYSIRRVSGLRETA